MPTYDYAYEKVKKFRPKDPRDKYRHIWTDDVVDGFRCIYMRCAGCHVIFELGSSTGTVGSEMTINPEGVVYPCIICPHCDSHIFAKLSGYKKADVPDHFD